MSNSDKGEESKRELIMKIDENKLKEFESKKDREARLQGTGWEKPKKAQDRKDIEEDARKQKEGEIKNVKNS